MQVLDPWMGLAILAVFGIASFVIAEIFTSSTQTKSSFLVADRTVGWKANSLSIAATWIWAPALFVAAEQGYKNGWVGVFWFTVPNVSCLIIFAFFAHIMRKRNPQGFTLSGYMRRYSTRVQRAYAATMSGLAICSFAVQLLAGGLVVSALTGLNFILVTVVLSLIAISYSLRSGLGGSIVTDYLQMGLIAVVGLVLAPWVATSAGWDVTLHGMAGSSGAFTSLTSGAGAAVFWSFGLSTTIGLLSGPFGDQSFWQRAYASKAGEVRKAFIVGAFVFAVVPLTMSLLGFAAAGSGLKVGNTQLTNLAAILEFLPLWTVIPFMFFILSGLVSTLDSNLAALSSIIGHDFTRSGKYVRNARVGMFALAVVGTLLANAPNLTVVGLFIFYGTLRASTLIPTVSVLLARRPLSEPGLFWGIMAALAVGVPMSAYGNLMNITEWKVAGSLTVLALSGIILWVATWISRARAIKAGALKPGESAVINRTRKPDPTFTREQWDEAMNLKNGGHKNG